MKNELTRDFNEREYQYKHELEKAYSVISTLKVELKMLRKVNKGEYSSTTDDDVDFSCQP